MQPKIFDDFDLFLKEFVELNKKYDRHYYEGDNRGCLGYIFYDKNDNYNYEYIMIKISSLPKKFTSLPEVLFISTNCMLYNAIIRGFFKDED